VLICFFLLPLVWRHNPYRDLVSSLRFLKSYLRIPLDEWWARRRGLYQHRTTQHRNTKANIRAPSDIGTHDPNNQSTKTYVLDSSATGTGVSFLYIRTNLPTELEGLVSERNCVSRRNSRVICNLLELIVGCSEEVGVTSGNRSPQKPPTLQDSSCFGGVSTPLGKSFFSKDLEVNGIWTCSPTFLFIHGTPNYNNYSWKHTAKFRLTERGTKRYVAIKSGKVLKLYWFKLINLHLHPMLWGMVIHFVTHRVHVEGTNRGKYSRFNNLILHAVNY
jgi:hypothetical protein